MNTYGQDAEVRLLSRILPLLDNRAAVDVGAERGAFVEALLEGGATKVHAFEPELRNAASLRTRFAQDERVAIHDVALSDKDGELVLRLSKDATGKPLSFGHTVLERPNTGEIAWDGTLEVRARSLGSLVESGELPDHVGVLKIDTEGHDFAVVAGMGALESDVIMVEHWVDLPNSLGRCPWSIEDLTALASSRHMNHFAFVSHRAELTILQWDDATIPAGSMGNILFIHDRVLAQVLPAVVACQSELAVEAVEAAETMAEVAWERLGVIEELKKELEVQSRAAAERLLAIEGLQGSA